MQYVNLPLACEHRRRVQDDRQLPLSGLNPLLSEAKFAGHTAANVVIGQVKLSKYARVTVET